MNPQDFFAFCPRCAVARSGPPGNPFRCTACDLTYFFNPTVAAAAFIRDTHARYIFLVRAKDPGQGLLTVPGGFIDIGETAEEALTREVREEVGLTITDIRFVLSLPNRYPYKEVVYPVCDLMFTATAVDPESAIVGDGATSIVWKTLGEVSEDEFAFPSVKRGLRRLRDGV